MSAAKLVTAALLIVAVILAVVGWVQAPAALWPWAVLALAVALLLERLANGK